MAEKKKTADGFCPECGRAILTDDGKCGFCGHQLSPEEMKAANPGAAGQGFLLSAEKGDSHQRVVITGIDINFIPLSLFLARMMLAAIPAAILAGIVIFLLKGIFLALFFGSFH